VATSTFQGLTDNYRYDLTGAGVKAYIIDSGIQSMHGEFTSVAADGSVTSRVTCGKNFREDLGEDCEDDWGHGTHVAGLLGGNTYGVAKDVQMIAIKVFGGDATSRFSNIIAGIEYVMEQKEQDPNQPMVLNLSLGTSAVSELMNEAVNAVVKAEVPVATAAGNGGVDACTFSPASANLAITVGASTKEEYVLSHNLKSYFSASNRTP
jgi:subtilisin family serine protease